MTTFNVLPIVGWSQVNFDWEQHMSGDGTPQMDCSKYPLSECLQHWQCGPACRAIRNHDFIARFSLDKDPSMVLAQTAGLQTGTVPYLVNEGQTSYNNSCFERPDLSSHNVSAPSPFCNGWIVKTYWAVALVHELRPSPIGCQPQEGPGYVPGFRYNLTQCWIPGSADGRFSPTPGAFNIPAILMHHGYADPACDVYRYWERPLPVSMPENPYVFPLLVRCPTGQDWPKRGAGRVLAIFSSFTPIASGGDHVKAQLDRAALGVRRGANATDAITLEPVGMSDGGELSFQLNSHDFRMIIIE